MKSVSAAMIVIAGTIWFMGACILKSSGNVSMSYFRDQLPVAYLLVIVGSLAWLFTIFKSDK